MFVPLTRMGRPGEGGELLGGWGVEREEGLSLETLGCKSGIHGQQALGVKV